MPYDALTEPEKEVDRRIGEAIWNEVRGEIVGIISKRANAVYHTGWKEHPSNTLDDLVRVLVCGDDDPDPFDGERRRRS
jgi:hypothetical protein